MAAASIAMVGLRVLGAGLLTVALGLGSAIAAQPDDASVRQRAASSAHRPTTPEHNERSGPGGSEAMLALPPADAERLALGQRIYQEGRGQGGRAISGVRFGGVVAEGAGVACVSCHRRSGLGAVEGTEQVSPVAGRFLFTDDPRAVVSMNLRTIKSFNQKHAALSDDQFAAAVMGGQHISGRELSPIMPRFALEPVELQALQAYLRTLSVQWSPGVTATTLQLATVITPEVGAERRALFLQTLRAAVAQKNGNVVHGMRTMSSAAEMLFRSDRHWKLAVWELTGAPATWAAQLDAFQRAEPAFALVSGLGQGEWAPVHRFCERSRVPCWFPSVDAPPAQADGDFYPVYFSAGVSLEADVLARHLGDATTPARPARLVQLHRGDAAGLMAAQRLQAALGRHAGGPTVQTHAVAGDTPAELRAALQPLLAGLAPTDALVLWWPAADMAALADLPDPRVTVYASARLAGAALDALPAAWAERWHYVYPYRPPAERHASLFYFHSWLKTRKIELRDEVMQAEVFYAMTYFSETLTDMIDNVHGDYLLERAENMLSLREGQKAEEETREQMTVRYNKAPGGAQGAVARLAQQPEFKRSPRPMPGVPAQLAIKREGTSIYPRLGLGQGQRYASKGAYIVRAVDGANRLVPRSDWIVP